MTLMAEEHEPSIGKVCKPLKGVTILRQTAPKQYCANYFIRSQTKSLACFYLIFPLGKLRTFSLQQLLTLLRGIFCKNVSYFTKTDGQTDFLRPYTGYVKFATSLLALLAVTHQITSQPGVHVTSFNFNGMQKKICNKYSPHQVGKTDSRSQNNTYLNNNDIFNRVLKTQFKKSYNF